MPVASYQHADRDVRKRAPRWRLHRSPPMPSFPA
jgi:hypothetical protein